LSSEQLKAWRDFIASAQNRKAFGKVQRVARSLDTLGTLPRPSAGELAKDDYDGSVPITEWNSRHVSPVYGKRPKFWSRGWLVSAAAVLAGCVVAASLWFALSAHFAPASLTYTTKAAEHRVIALPDASKLELGARTSVEIEYTARRRLLRLKSGEALFTVAHDRARPFVVVAGGRTITAVGTAFNIWRELDRTVVTVTEGTIDVAPVVSTSAAVANQAPAQRPARVTHGQKVTYVEHAPDASIEIADLGSETAWRDGRLVYHQVPLKYVISDVNRYFSEQFEIGDLSIGELRFSGAVLQTQSPGEFLRALASIFPIEAVKSDSGRILLRSRAAIPAREPGVVL
jgi:transmembrane sensor